MDKLRKFIADKKGGLVLKKWYSGDAASTLYYRYADGNGGGAKDLEDYVSFSEVTIDEVISFLKKEGWDVEWRN